MPGQSAVAVGDIVYVYNYHGRGGSHIEARVEKVARVLVTLSYNGRELHEKFRLDTGRMNRDGGFASTPYYLTADEKLDRELLAADEAVFRAVGLHTWGTKLKRDDIRAVAELLRSRGFEGQKPAS